MIDLQYILFAYLSSLLSSGIALCSKQLTYSVPPLVIALLRFTISTLCLMPFVKWSELRKLNAQLVASLAFLGFVGISIANYIYLTGLAQTTAINAAIITSMVPIMVLLLYCVINRKQPTRQQLGAFIISFLGVILIVTQGRVASLSSLSIGDLYILGSALCWATFGIMVKRLSTHISTYFITFCSNAFGLLFVIPTVDTTEFIATIPNITSFQWMLIFYIGSLGTALNYFVYSEAMRYLGPPTAAFLIYGNIPVFVALLSYIILGQPLLATHIVGIAMVLYALYLSKGGGPATQQAVEH